jgi:hypothetical protein
VDVYSFRQPLGVCAGITPFNFPVMVPMWMHPIAIAAGKTVVLKPSERDPSASSFTARLYAEAGLPEGVFNLVVLREHLRRAQGQLLQRVPDPVVLPGGGGGGHKPLARRELRLTPQRAHALPDSELIVRLPAGNSS